MAVKPPEIIRVMRAVRAQQTTPEAALQQVLLQSLQPMHREALRIGQRLAAERDVFTSVEVADELPSDQRPSRTHMSLIMAQLRDLGLVEQVGNVERLKVYRLPDWLRAG